MFPYWLFNGQWIRFNNIFLYKSMCVTKKAEGKTERIETEIETKDYIYMNFVVTIVYNRKDLKQSKILIVHPI